MELPCSEPLKFRSATNLDKRALEWRNDSVTRQNSRRQHELSWDEFFVPPLGVKREMYIAYINKQNKGFLHMGQNGGDKYEINFTAIKDIGYLYLDYIGDKCEISCAIAPEMRGLGYGSAFVKALMQESGRDHFYAEIFAGNAASRKLFQGLGFSETSRKDDLCTLEYSRNKSY